MLKQLNINRLRISSKDEAHATATVSATLQQAINDYGPILPVMARPGRAGCFQIIANARTWIAARRAGYEELSVLIREASESEARALLAIDAPEDPIARARCFAEALKAQGRHATHGAITAAARTEQCSR